MAPIHEFLYVRAATFGLFDLYFLLTGLYGILARKPLMVSTKWLLGLFLVIFLPALAVPFILPVHNAQLDVMLWTTVPILGLVLVLFWKAANGYSLYGTDDVSVRKALLASLGRLGLKSTEDSTGIHLTEDGLTIKVSIIVGMGNMRVRGKDPQGVVARLAPVLREELSKPGVEFSFMPFLFQLLMGVTFMVLIVSMLNLF